MTTRMLIIGSCGAGKSTLAQQLSQRFNIVRLELDSLYWGPEWRENSTEQMKESVRKFLDTHDEWIIEGNYESLQSPIWSRATHILWLDYSFHKIFTRLLKRSIYRCIQDQELWHGNRESLKRTFFSRNSIILWLLRTHWRRRARYEEKIRQTNTPDPTQICRVKNELQLNQELTKIGLRVPSYCEAGDRQDRKR